MKLHNIVKCRVTFLIVLITMVVLGLVIGCSDSIMKDDYTRTSDNKMTAFEMYGLVDELWIIDTNSVVRSGLTVEDIEKILMENQHIFTVDGEVNVDLLKEFIFTYFKNVETITDPDEIIEILQKKYYCCVIDPKTRTVRIILVVK